MAYIGSSAAPLPVAFATAQAEPFSGNGSTTSFTLARSVLKASDIEVLVNNVRQSPYDGSYSINNTTLTFSEAPSSGSSNVYVIYRDQPLASIVPTTGSVGKLQLDASNLNGTGAAVIPSGTTAQRPASQSIGMVRYNTDTAALENYTSTGWLKVSVQTPVISGVTGAIYSGAQSTLSLSGQNFGTGVATVTFTSGATTATATATPTNAGTAISVLSPSSIYGLGAGSSVLITVTSADGVTSAALTATVLGVPTGGTVTTSGAYRVHTFNSSGTFAIPSGVTLSNVEYVVVAGGGGGGSGNGPPSASGGGGGAGGYRSSVVGESSGGGASAESRLSGLYGNYTVTIGAGGTGRTDDSGNLGGNTVFGSITALGGGGGGCGSPYGPTSGGSGGGGDYIGGASGTSGQGFAGGSGRAGPYYGGGGGGAGQTGRDYTTNAGRNGDGGYGVQSSITGTATYRAGGGGSGVYSGNDTGVGIGGLGGGGNGGKVSSGGSNGTANTGGGGGGGPRSVPFSGGSGVVIIRYQL